MTEYLEDYRIIIFVGCFIEGVLSLIFGMIVFGIITGAI